MRLARNSLYSLLSAGLPVLVSLVTIPLYIAQIGAERYGALAICWLLLGYFGQADFGLGRAITQRIGAMQGASGAQQATAVASAITAILGAGLLGATLVYFGAQYFFGSVFQIDDDLRGQLLRASWALALCTPVVAVSGILSGSLMGLERFKLPSIGNLAGTIGMQILPLLAAYFWTLDLAVLVGCALFGRAASLVILGLGVWATFFRNAMFKPAISEIRSLLGYGSWIMVSALIGPLMIVTDRFIIGSIMGAAAVAAYTIPFQIASRAQILPIAVVNALFPRFAAEKGEVARERCRTFAVFIAQLFTPLVVGLICLSEPLLTLWLGDGLDTRSIAVAQVLLAGFWCNALANVPYAYIQARGNSRFTALLHMAELPIYLVLLFALGATFGLAGIATAFALRCLIDMLALLMKSGALSGAILRRAGTQVVLVAVALVIGHSNPPWAILAVSASVLVGISLALTAWQIPPEIRGKVAQLLATFKANRSAR